MVPRSDDTPIFIKRARPCGEQHGTAARDGGVTVGNFCKAFVVHQHIVAGMAAITSRRPVPEWGVLICKILLTRPSRYEPSLAEARNPYTQPYRADFFVRDLLVFPHSIRHLHISLFSPVRPWAAFRLRRTSSLGRGATREDDGSATVSVRSYPSSARPLVVGRRR
jgi:hypothetical protein